ncbi:kinesin-like protein KIF21A isoform X5 [Ostrea edulis]|uniref:kinesin-like protein KIF21A isoform X5 n=1 Tax=Ostrea edulis TaxID=37623 RepID=UPI0024AF1BC9|nr:kinesin-like protein KIF21A isoform X5 [Ostrea edulis]
MMTESKDTKEDDSSVRVALRIRPQLAKEKIDMCQVCTSVEDTQVIMGKDKSFTYDYVFDMPTLQETIYGDCVRILIDGCFEGYNATVFAYGQTGSGKTYTMGTGFDVNLPENEVGIIPRAVDHLFKGIEECKRKAKENNIPPPDFKVNAQFIELYNEEILDLLDSTRDPESRMRKSHIKIHEDATGGIYMVGVATRPVQSMEDTMECLKNGALSRATASTNMNSQSSRSHAIFTLHIKQQRVVHDEDLMGESKDSEGINEFETLTAKFHFVDLAGSERLKRTGATGDRAKEGISINCGLLALGNVISALGDKAKKGSHVPYRDSKLTRLLQDSLGGNSRTLMIACISPSDRDFVETLNTLKYANRARNIKNKIVANQDKSSKQLAALRAEIATLQQELMDYKTGKRRVDEDGVETVNDMFHENTMLQTENDKLRQRIKAMHETVEMLTKRNSDLLAEKAVLGVYNISEDARDSEVTKLIEGYIKELEELRAKLVEAEHTAEQYRRKTVVTRMGSSMSLMNDPVSPISPGHLSGSIMGSMTESKLSIIDEAKRDVSRMKKLKKLKKKMYSKTGEKEDHFDSEKDRNEAEQNEEDPIEEGKEENKEEENNANINGEEDDDGLSGELNGDDEEDDDLEEELENLSSDSDSEERDSDNLHEDLAELTCSISIKQRLVEELEQAQKQVQAVRHQYEDKVRQLQMQIRATQEERDKVLSNINSVESQSVEKVKKVKDEYEKKLITLQRDLKKTEQARRDYTRMQKQSSYHEKQLKTLQHELEEMKRTKVKLMKQVKEELEKGKAVEARRTREVSQLRKDQVRKENMIRNLEKEKRQKEVVLKRKQEELNVSIEKIKNEVEALRKKEKKPMSAMAAGRVAKYDRPKTIPVTPFTSSPRRKKRTEFSAKASKQKWDTLEKKISNVITKKQTIINMEKDMDIWLKERESVCKKLDKFCKKRDVAIKENKDDSVIGELNCIIGMLQGQVQYTQEYISECQSQIMQIEEAKEDNEGFDATSLISNCSVEEARYLLAHFIQTSIGRGLALSQKENELKEMREMLHQTELNNTLQQDLLKHMINDRVDIEVDNLMTNAADDVESSEESSSSSPADRILNALKCSMFENTTETTKPTAVNSTANAPIAEPVGRGLKVRRKTPLPQELLYADGSLTPLLPLPETPEEDEGDPPRKEPPEVPPKPTKKPATQGVESQLMPPPRTVGMMKMSSSSNLSRIGVEAAAKPSRPDPGPSPRFQRKEYTKPSPEPSPVFRRKNNSSSSLISRSSSIDATSSDATPPSSPTLSRRSRDRPTDDNVFSRLTSNTQPPAIQPPNRGQILPNTGKVPLSKTAPVVCTHTAEGHTKAVLSLDATEDLLFTSSKDRTAKIWDLHTGKEVASFTSHPNNVVCVRYCPQSRLLFTVSQSYVSVWDTRTSSRQCVKTLSSSGLTHDGCVNFGSTRQIELAPGEHHINDIVLNQDGTALYSAAGSVVRVWDLKSFSAIGKLNGGHQAAVMAIAVDRWESKDIVLTGSKDHYIKMFEVVEERAGIMTPKYNLEPPHYDGIQSLCIHDDTLFSGSRDMCIKKWDLSSQQLKHSINSAHKDWICALKFMPENSVLFSGCRGGFLKLWNVENCNQLGEIKAHTSPINAIATNSSAIFTASNETVVKFWQYRRIQSLTTLWESGPSSPEPMSTKTGRVWSKSGNRFGNKSRV